MNKLEDLLYSTVRISAEQNDGSILNGTGFFYKLKEYPEAPVLVCNQHLMNNAQNGTISFHVADENNNITNTEHMLTIENIHNICSFHYDGLNDICIINIFNIFSYFNDNNIKLYYNCISSEMIPSEDDINNLHIGNDIFLVGYPDDLYDQYNKLPILRKGALATQYSLSYNGTNTFLIDAAIYSGSSGSPVISVVNDKILFLGVQKSMHLHEFGVNSEFITSYIKIPNNLGLVTKSNVLLTLPI